MNVLMKLLYKWQKRSMCNCESPRFGVMEKKLFCINCGKLVHKLDVDLRSYK